MKLTDLPDVPHRPNVILTIDERAVHVPPGTLLIEAARQAGISIPFFCYHPKLTVAAQCRMCLVEVVGVPKLLPACAVEATSGMVVLTKTPDVERTREGVLEILLANHPLDCPICDKGGECPLQDLTFQYGPGKGHFEEEKKHFEKPIALGREILLDRERCILCTRCVRFCDEVSGHRQLGLFMMRGNGQVGIFRGEPFDSQFSGNTVELCPVGALTSCSFRFKARPWEMKHTPCVCTLCGLGCNVTLDSREERILRMMARENPAVDDGWLCDRGRYETLKVIHHPDRLTTPLRKVRGSLMPVSWEEALKAAAVGLERLRSPGETTDLIAGFGSGRFSNETLYLFRKFMEEVLHSPHAGLSGLDGGREWTRFVGQAANQGLVQFSIRDTDRADTLVILGTDPSRVAPVLDLRIKKAVRRGTRLFVLYPEEIELCSRAEGWIRLKAGQGFNLLHQWDQGFRENVVPLDRGLHALFQATAASSSILILLGPHGFEGCSPEGMVTALTGLTGKLIKEGRECRTGILFPQANTQGGLDMGLDPGLWVKEIPLRGLFLVGAESLADLGRRISSLEFLLVMETHRTEDLEIADLVLPLSCSAEEDGSMTNIEGRVQCLRRSIRALGQARPGWQILSALAQEMGMLFWYSTAQEVLNEISERVSGYEGVGEIGRLGEGYVRRPFSTAEV